MTNNKDLLQRFLLDQAPIRGEYVHLQTSFQTILQQHAYPAPIRRLLGEALCVAVLLSAIIKFDGRLTVQFRGKGKLKMLLAQCNNAFHIRGLAKWEGDLSYDDLMEAFNDGVLAIMLDSQGTTQNRYQGIVAWRGNSLTESIEGYFRESEQLATKIWLAVDEHQAAGFLLQVMPGTENQATTLEEADKNPYWQEVQIVTSTLREEELLNKDYAELLRHLYPEAKVAVFPASPVEFRCLCSRVRSENAILVIGIEEAEAELSQNQSIVVTCDFCNKEYFFDRTDVAKIFEDQNRPLH